MSAKWYIMTQYSQNYKQICYQIHSNPAWFFNFIAVNNAVLRENILSTNNVSYTQNGC